MRRRRWRSTTRTPSRRGTRSIASIDHYELLGIHPSATQEQIKAAYRRQALRYHPDKNPDDPDAAERFKACNDAFSLLSDVDRRAEYDRRRRVEGKGPRELVGNLVDDILGARRPRRKRDGRDVNARIKLSLEEAALGVSRRIQFKVPESCGACSGSGAAPGGTRTCPECEGKGELRDRSRLLSLPQRCPRCGGQRVVITEQCKACGALGTVDRPREYMVRIPGGARSGDVRVVEGQGEPGRNGGTPGDLLVRVEVERDPLFTVRGSDLVIQVPISLITAARGGVAVVPTLEGEVKMKIPPGTQSGRTFRLRKKGLRRTRGRGDQLVQVDVETPVALGAEQLRILEELERALTPAMEPRRAEFQRQVAAREADSEG